MPQVLKPEVRERILGAALTLFAQRGFAGTTMQDIARGAGMAVANLYRYYASKEELFDAAVPREIVARFEQLLERSVQAHAHLAGLPRPRDEAAAGELLEFWIEQRQVVIVLLDRAQGSVHEGFAQRFVERLVALSLVEIRRAHPGAVVQREARLVLGQIFENTRRMIAVLLESCADAAAIRRAVAAFRNYQVAGLAAFARGVASEGAGDGTPGAQ
ncbi:MAG TPA: helix-turn-helix domain-containing protein [Polyangiaceae bacterium]|nr:helix-turn-helix domain-containing protein [Polyangiaceae bacterium]